MLKLTLDTNCIINLLDYKSESATSVNELTEILRYGLEGDVNIAITTRVESDVNKDINEERKNELLRRVSMFPVVGTVARWDVTKLDGGDVISGEEHVALENEIKNIVFPGLKAEDAHFGNKINDVDHLIGHKINSRDIFITDDGQILKKAESLKSSLGIVVMNPAKAVEYLNLKANKLVLAQEFYEKFMEYKEILFSITPYYPPKQDVVDKFNELRNWLIKKYPIIKDGLLQFKFEMVSVPVNGQRIFDQGKLRELQDFNDRFSNVLEQRTPELASKGGYFNTYHYASDDDQIQVTKGLLESVEDSLSGYIGRLENL